jgi:predicted Fe-Mo cluster-binding NifX family protein
MKIAVSSTGNNVDSDVDPRFGRCLNFLIVDTDTMEVEAIGNSGARSAHGAGIGAAQKVASQEVGAVVTGHVGPNAYMALSKTGIKIYTGATGTVKNAITQFNEGKLKEAFNPTVSGHHGQGRRRRL